MAPTSKSRRKTTPVRGAVRSTRKSTRKEGETKREDDEVIHATACAERVTRPKSESSRKGTILTDLPGELLPEIFSSISGGKDILSISLVSRCFSDEVADQLSKSKLYRKMKFGDSGAQRYRSLLCSTLATFLNEPKLALYVEEIDLTWEFSEQSEILEMTDDEGRSLLNLIFTKTKISEWKDGKGFVVALKKHRQEAYVALLLLLLRNLKVLRISIAPEDVWLTWAVEKSATSSFLQSSFLCGLRSVASVKVFPNTNGQEMNEDYFLTVDKITPFFVLPSINKVKAVYVMQYADNGYFKWNRSYGTSTLKHLCFKRSYLDVEVALEILEIPQHLESFYLRNLYIPDSDHGIGKEDLQDFCEELEEKGVKDWGVKCPANRIYLSSSFRTAHLS